ncbi:MAG: hypothetical protein V1934_08690 [Methanobacteriota archaeon]
MFLLTNKKIIDYMEEGLLDIENFKQELLSHTYYNFRLGNLYRLWDSEKEDWQINELDGGKNNILFIPPGGYALIKSYERFYCSKKVMAIFGQKSNLQQMGLSLNHSPSIDPGFRGYLELGLVNYLSKPVEICVGEIIGKALFFDVSDTYPVGPINPLDEANYLRRQKLEDGPIQSNK